MQQLLLLPTSTADLGGLRGASVDAQGNFEMRGVNPGSYALTAAISEGSKSYTGRLPLTVSTSDIENAVVTITLGYEVTGSIKLEAVGGATIETAAMRPVLRPAEPSGLQLASPASTPIADDGTFTISSIGPDRYFLALQPLQPGQFIKSIRMGEEDVLETPLDFTRGPGAPIRIVLRNNAPEVSGLVTSSTGKPMPGATVVLIPDQGKRRDQQQWYKTSTTDQSGRYTIKSVDPGKYKVLAWEDIDQGAWMDPDLIQPLETKAKAITLKEGVRESLDLKIIPAE
jgi:hypothetical protein